MNSSQNKKDETNKISSFYLFLVFGQKINTKIIPKNHKDSKELLKVGSTSILLLFNSL